MTSTFPRWEGDTEPAFVHALCERLSESFDMWVLAPHAPGAKFRETFGNIQVVRFRYFFDWGESLNYQGGIMAKLRSNRLRYLLVPIYLLCQWLALTRLLATHRFHWVHAHWLFPQGFVASVAKLIMPNFPALVCTSHGTDINGLRGAFFSTIKRFVIRQSSAVTVVSAPMKSIVRSLGADPQRTSVIPMGVDATGLFTPDRATPRRARELLFVGRLDSQKGLDVLIAAMPAVLASFPDCTLLIVGAGPERKRLQEQANSLGLAQSVVFTGAIVNRALPDFYRKATALVFPSVGAEGLPLVCAEALACECPIVASNFSSVQEIVQDGVSGLIFQSGDGADLTTKIRMMLPDAQLRDAMGTAGRVHVLAHLDWSRVVADFTDVYNRVRCND